MKLESTDSLEKGEVSLCEPLVRTLAPLNRTIVSDDMERAADLLDEAVGIPAKRYPYPSGAEYGSWVVPPSWNVREAFLSDGEKTIASYQDQVLFLAPYSAPFEGWVSRQDLLEHLLVSPVWEDAFSYQHRVAYDFQKRLRRWEISLPKSIADSLNRDRYFVKIDLDVRPGTMNVLEYTAPGREETSVALLAHLCHPGQVNDGLSGVAAGVALIRRFLDRPRRFTYKLLVMPETVGSAVHVVAQGIGWGSFSYAVFFETLGGGERLFLKSSRTGARPVDWAIRSVVRDRPEIGVHGFFEGYENDEMVFDFVNVDIPAIGVQYYPFREYHSSRDCLEIMDWGKWAKALEVVEELFRRVEEDRIIRLRYPGPPYLSRYRLYADATLQRSRNRQILKLLSFCDGRHSVLQICEETGLPYGEVADFFSALGREGLLDVG